MAARSKLGRWRFGYSGTSCPRCRVQLRHDTILTGPQNCRACQGAFEAVRFDPIKPVVAVPQLAGVGVEAAAPCARHGRNQAVTSCSRCGQFMCSLCRIDVEGSAYCPPCFERLSTEGVIPGGQMRVRNYAGMASLCLLGSFFMWFLSPVTAPLGIYFSIRGLKDKRKRNEADGVVRLYVMLGLCTLIFLGALSLFGAILGAFGRWGSR